jgi:RNA polymerase primary sigma factor
MEAELKPQVVETFDRIAEAYGKMRKLQDQHVDRPLCQAGDAVAEPRSAVEELRRK